MTSHAVSRGYLTALVGKRYVLRVYFAGIHSLFAFILLTHKIMIMFCIGAGYIGHCVGGSFYVVIIQRKGKRRKLWLNVVSCKQWGGRSFNNYQPSFIDISYHPAFIATHINTSYITESTTTGCILCWKENK